MTMRIGHGYDIHALGPGDHVTLGGLRIAHDRGLVAHSDGEVLLHALCDALLGAAALGDIGRHFPDSDERYRGIDSRRLLHRVVELIRTERLAVAAAAELAAGAVLHVGGDLDVAPPTTRPGRDAAPAAEPQLLGD